MQRTLILAGGWWIITEADPSALVFGVAVVVFTLVASRAVPSAPAPSWSATGLLGYGRVFLVGSVLGGIDVARRALAPRLPIAPTILRYPLRLATGPARRLFMGTLSLMPGTLSVRLDGDSLDVHVLFDEGEAGSRRLRDLEAHVARAVGDLLEGPHA
ncbi:MAG: Na+/H+ antiporter subunit E [Myxococcota bacterium]